MKKILAIAVATAIAAPAMADMTITGSAAAGYSYGESGSTTYTYVADKDASADNQVLSTAGAENTAGFGIDTASIKISASAETESGLTVAAYIGAGGFTRGSSVGGENAGLSVAGDFGKVTIHAIEAGKGTTGLALAGAPVESFEGEVFGDKVNVDQLRYDLPAMGAAKLALIATETVGVGAGEDATALTAEVSVAAGSFKSKADYTNFANNTSRIRVSGNVDLGAVVVGAGYETTEIAAVNLTGAALTAANAINAVAANTVTTTAAAYDLKVMQVGVAVPMGATTLGAAWGKQEGASSSVNGWTVGVEHKLSETVAVTVKHAQWDGDNQKGSALVSLSF